MKKFIPCIIFILVTLLVVCQLNNILIPKAENRYYMLEKYLEEHPEDTQHDVQVYGSCHSYTSFNPVYLEETTGISGFVYGNPGEIIPTTYVRMTDQFKNHVPKVALVEIWGINPYETYSSHERVFGFYLANNLERTGSYKAKQEVINDFSHMEYEDISFLSMNLPVINYKDRIADGSLTAVDFSYSFEDLASYSSYYTFNEMSSRFANNGYKANPSVAIEDYPEKQNYIEEDEFAEIEPDIVKYIQKIIELCEENDVELIFYRSPYTSTENELKKLNHLQQICDAAGVKFIDLEEEIQFDYTYDFIDYQHLSEIGANKATAYLSEYIMEALDVQPQPQAAEEKHNLADEDEFIEADWNEDGDGEGWYIYQDIENVQELEGKSITAYFDIEDHEGAQIKPIVSFRDENIEELTAVSAEIEDGELIISCVVPGLTEYIRVGFYAYEGTSADDFVEAEEIEVYPGAYRLEDITMLGRDL